MIQRAALAYVLLSIQLAVSSPLAEPVEAGPKLPDFSQYIDLQMVTRKHLNTDEPSRRILFIGDIHGMLPSLQQLLGKVHYNQSRDTLVHTGDIITKGVDSLGTLDWLSSNRVLGVRGNQDEKVIEWRGWIDWVSAQHGGVRWLSDMEQKYHNGVECAYMRRKKKGRRFPVQDEWFFNGDHYNIAKTMSRAHYDYLLQLPLTLHIAPLHTLVGHAGMLPMDPTRKPTNKRQPLSHVPDLDHPKPPTRLLRLAQESAIVRDVPQNISPWARLNMRSILADGSVSRDGDDGEPWSNLWNAVMGMCNGFMSAQDEHAVPRDQLVFSDKSKLKLPCHPSTVVYGHAASRGLELKHWSKGLDTGCVYGRRLTAMIVGGRGKHFDVPGDIDDDNDDDDEKLVDFGEQWTARVASVRCPQAADPLHS